MRKVEKAHTSIATTTGHDPYPPCILGQRINPILMPLQRPDKRLGKHPIHLGRRHGTRVFPCTREGMQRGVEVALYWVRGSGGGGEVVVEGAGDDFDFHGGRRVVGRLTPENSKEERVGSGSSLGRLSGLEKTIQWNCMG